MFSDLRNVVVLPGGQFILSAVTFEDYFNKANIQDKKVDPTMDIELFAEGIAPVLSINVRFAGEEPLDAVTKQYNETMRRILPEYGIEFCEVPRKKTGDQVISASRVRKLMAEKNYERIRELVPPTTYEYLLNRNAASP